jgi:NAD(P)H-dependent FMN reductase
MFSEKMITMPHIAIISSSVRTGRNTHKVARFLERYLQENRLASTEILDLGEYQFPILEERIKYQKTPTAKVLDFVERFKKSDGIIIVTPEYNGGYPASLKNVVDLMYEEWYKKPVAISTVSAGSFGGTQVITSLQFTLWKMKAWVAPAQFPVPKVQENFDEEGQAIDKARTDKRAASFLGELLWSIEAKRRMEGY